MNTIDCRVVRIQATTQLRKDFKSPCLWIGATSGVLNYSLPVPTDDIAFPQHLYFTSDEPIKEGDYYYGMINGTLSIQKHVRVSGILPRLHAAYEKVVASTDPSLKLPTIPEPFIQKYVAANGKIDRVRISSHEGHAFVDFGNKVVVVYESLSVTIIDLSEDKELEDAAIKYWKTQVRRDTAKPGNLAFCTKDFKEGWKAHEATGRVWTDEDMLAFAKMANYHGIDDKGRAGILEEYKKN